MEIDDPIAVNHDNLVDHLAKLKNKSDDIKSRGGEMRKFSGQFNDDYGFNQKAKNMLMTLHNMTEEKRNDCLRTLIPGLESLVPMWVGQTTADMFDDDAPEPVADTDPSNVTPFNPDEETKEFDAAADEAMGA